jgi:glycolate oxidase FAD binding subunit
MTVETVAELLKNANTNGESVLVSGGNTLRGMGRPALRADVTLSTLKLNKIVEDAPLDLTIAVQAGVTLRALAHTLAPHGTHVPFDAPRNADATVGGTLAAGWIGPRRHVYGRPRDFLIGSVVVLADGTIARAGGMVVKNVAGYDMSRLYVGSFGTLAVLVQANLKTVAAPQTQRVFAMRLPEGTRERALSVLSSLNVVPAAAFWIDGFHGAIDGDDGQEGRMIVLLEGSAHTIDRLTRDVRSAVGRAGVPETRIIDAGARDTFERVLDAYVANVGERSITYRIPTFPDEALECARNLTALAVRFELRHDAIVDAMNGDVIFRVSDLDAMALGAKIEMFDDALHDAQPEAIVIAGNHSHRPLLAVWGADPPAIAQMRALKARFDPKNTLNPGRFVAGI